MVYPVTYFFHAYEHSWGDKLSRAVEFERSCRPWAGQVLGLSTLKGSKVVFIIIMIWGGIPHNSTLHPLGSYSFK